MTAIYGDHCVLRAHSPLQVIGGGIVICPLPPVLRKRNKDYEKKMALLNELAEPDKNNYFGLAYKSSQELVNISLDLAPLPGLNLRLLQVLTNLNQDELKNALEHLDKEGLAYCWDEKANYWISQAQLENCIEQCATRARELHEREPLKTSFAPSALLYGWGENLPERFTGKIIELGIEKNILQQEGAGLKLCGHKTRLDPQAMLIMEILRSKINENEYAPPFIREIAEEQQWDLKKIAPVLSYLCDIGEFIKIQEGVYYNKQAFSKIMEHIKKWFENNEELDVGNIKNILDISRKYAIPILEYLDSIHITYREENKRKLRKKL